MLTSDLIASLALIVGSAALALEVRRWLESGVKLRLTAQSDVTAIPDDDGSRKHLLNVENYGDRPTTIRHMILKVYKTPLHRLLNKPELQGFIPKQYEFMTDPPCRILPGDYWTGLFHADDEIEKWRLRGCVFVGVSCTDRPQPYLAKVPRTPLYIEPE